MDAAGQNRYDALNRPTMWENTQAGDVLFARSWQQYDRANREVATWREQDGNRGERFTYELTNQLARAAYNAENVWTGTPENATRTVDYAYTPDKLNRLSMNDNGNVSTYTPNALNQYENVGGGSVSYDGNFNLTGLGGFWAIYNAANQLVSAQSGEDTAQFVYDGLGRCLKRTVSWETTLIVYDGWKPIVEWNVWEGQAYFKAWNVYGPGADEILWRYADSSGHLRYHSDRHGNIVALLDGAGNGIEKYSYDVFGRATVTDWSGGDVRYGSWYWNRFLFQGREYFPELGLYDYRNRFYHPILGRFLQTDPTGFDAGDMNLFRYCGDDPVDGSDPTGLISVDATWSRLMHWQGHSQDSFNDIAEAYRNWQPAGMSGGVNINWQGLVGMGNAARVDSAVRNGPSVNWQDTGDENISQPYVYSEKGAQLPARTFTEINVVGERYKGKLIGLYVDHKVDVKYASTAGPNTRKWARDVEPAHRNELRAWGLDSGRDIARGIASKYRSDPQRAVNEANRVLKNELRKQAQQSHLYHDYQKPIGIGDHISKHPYEW